MRHRIFYLCVAAFVLQSCEKETEEPVIEPYTPEYTFKTRPFDTLAVRVWVNGVPQLINHDADYPEWWYLQPQLFDTVVTYTIDDTIYTRVTDTLYYCPPIPVHRNDVIRVESDGRNYLYLVGTRVYDVTADTVEWSVFPN